MKLNHYLASAGVCSRRNAAELVKEGRVTINASVMREPWFEVTEKHKVAVDGKPVAQAKKLYVLMNKPKNCVTTVSDEQGRKTVVDFLYPDIKERMFPVGRLDKMTTGLLVLTNDGELSQRLAHPRYEVQKVYEVMIDRPLEDRDLKKIEQGFFLDGSMTKVDSVRFVSPQNRTYVRVALHSGKYRVVRRLFERLGYFVESLDRVVYAFLNQRALPVGRWRYLTPGEVKRLLSLSESQPTKDTSEEQSKNVRKPQSRVRKSQSRDARVSESTYTREFRPTKDPNESRSKGSRGSQSRDAWESQSKDWRKTQSRGFRGSQSRDTRDSQVKNKSVRRDGQHSRLKDKNIRRNGKKSY